MNYQLIQTAHVDAIWPMIAEGIKASVERVDCDLTVPFLWQLCRSGAGYLVGEFGESVIDGASIWRFEQYRTGGKLCCLALWTPDYRRWRDGAKPLVTSIANAGGANGLISEGSHGYARLNPQVRQVRTLFEEPL